MSMRITPETLLASKRECLDAAYGLYGERLMDVVQLSGTSLCIGDAPRDELPGRRLYFSRSYHDGLADITDGCGERVGFIPLTPLLKLMLDTGRDAVLQCVYYSFDDGIPSVIAVILSKSD